MQYCKPEYIAELQKDQELKYWRIYDSSGKTEMNNQLSDISLNQSIELLQKDLENTSGDYVIVRLYATKPERNSAGSAATTGISRKVSLQGGISKAPSGYGSAAGLDLILGLVEEKNKLNLEILKLQLEQQQKEGSWKDKAINLIQEKPEILAYIPSLLSGLFGNKNAIAAPPSVPAANNSASASERLKNTLDRFAALDPDYLSTLEKMAAKCEADPNILPVLKAGL
jgi:hypothetical protein